MHKDGTATTTVTFAHPSLQSSQPRMVKLKRELDAIKSVPTVFAKSELGRLASVESGGCKGEWEYVDPKLAAAANARAEKERAATVSPIAHQGERAIEMVSIATFAREHSLHEATVRQTYGSAVLARRWGSRCSWRRTWTASMARSEPRGQRSPCRRATVPA